MEEIEARCPRISDCQRGKNFSQRRGGAAVLADLICLYLREPCASARLIFILAWSDHPAAPLRDFDGIRIVWRTTTWIS